MKSVLKPVFLLLFITLLLSGLTTITNTPPELPQNPGSGSHESNFTESYNETTLKVDEVPPIMVASRGYIPQEPASPLSPVTASILPVADLASNVTVGSVPLSVKFTDSSSNATSISWDVNGDGIEDSNSSEFVYVYNSAGTYNVSINATNTNGSDTKTIVDHISVIAPEVGPLMVIADFTTNVSSGVPPFSVMFTDLSQNATSISWDVNGDEVEDSNASEFVYVYNTPSTYDVSLTATNSNGNDVKFDTVISYFSEEVPEFPTIALPVLIVLGLMFLFQRKK